MRVESGETTLMKLPQISSVFFCRWRCAHSLLQQQQYSSQGQLFNGDDDDSAEDSDFRPEILPCDSFETGERSQRVLSRGGEEEEEEAIPVF